MNLKNGERVIIELLNSNIKTQNNLKTDEFFNVNPA